MAEGTPQEEDCSVSCTVYEFPVLTMREALRAKLNADPSLLRGKYRGLRWCADCRAFVPWFKTWRAHFAEHGEGVERVTVTTSPFPDAPPSEEWPE